MRALLVVSRAALVESSAGTAVAGLAEGGHLEALGGVWDRVEIVGQAVESDRWPKAAELYVPQRGNVRASAIPSPRSTGLVARSVFYARAAPALWRATGRSDAVLVFLPGWLGALAALVARRRRRALAVYLGGDWDAVARHDPRWRRGAAASVSFAYRAIASRMQREAIRAARLILARGSVLQRSAADLAGPSARVADAPPLVGLGIRDVLEAPPPATGSSPRLLFVGALLPVKGVETLLRALAQLRDAGEQVSLSVVGDGPDRARLEGIAHRLALADAVRFEGYVPSGPRLLSAYREHDVFVLPSRSEGFPRVIVEAMSQGLPVVATAAGGVAEEIRDGREALLVAPDDHRALAEAIGRLLADTELRRRLQEAGIALARRALDVPRLADVVTPSALADG